MWVCVGAWVRAFVHWTEYGIVEHRKFDANLCVAKMDLMMMLKRLMCVCVCVHMPAPYVRARIGARTHARSVPDFTVD